MSIRQMTKDTLNALKGWPNPAAVDYHAAFAADVLADHGVVYRGSVVHLDEDGNYALGLGTEAVMPLFLFHNSNEPDVDYDGGDPATEKGVTIGISSTGQAMALPAIGAYELVSTSFVDTEDYPPNTPLTSPLSGADAGKLTPGTLYTDMICGLVSRGVIDNGYGEDAVAFWPDPVYPNP